MGKAERQDAPVVVRRPRKPVDAENLPRNRRRPKRPRNRRRLKKPKRARRHAKPARPERHASPVRDARSTADASLSKRPLRDARHQRKQHARDESPPGVAVKL